jgi:hemerythrin-like domain-containing protein
LFNEGAFELTLLLLGQYGRRKCQKCHDDLAEHRQLPRQKIQQMAVYVSPSKARDPGRAASIADLQAEHREGAVRLRRVARAIDNVLNDQEVLRESVDRLVRDFIDNERKHIALEDEVIFPAIVDALQPADWADIALRLADRYGPPSEADFEEQFSTLRRNILELEKAAVARCS